MNDAVDFVTVWGPDAENRTALLRSTDDPGVMPEIIWAASPAGAWAHAKPSGEDAWGCSARFAAALDLDPSRIAVASDVQAMNLYDALYAATPGLKMMGMKYAEDAVGMLRAFARLKDLVHLIKDGRSTPFKVHMEAPDATHEFYCALSRSGDAPGIHIADSPAKIRKLYEVGLSGQADLNFNMIYAGFGADDPLICDGIEDICGTRFVPQVFEYENGTPNPMTGGTSRVVAALVVALCGFLTDGPGTRHGTATRRGVYAVDLEIIDV